MKLVNTRLLGLALVVTCVACSQERETEVTAEAPAAPEAIALGPTVGPATVPATPGAEMPYAGNAGTAPAPGTAAPATGPSSPTGGSPEGAAPALAPAPAPAAAADDNSIYAGVYTRAQATRGNQTQQRECSACHSPQDWASGRLLSAWNGRPLYDLTNHVRNTMPLDSPGRLTFEQYTDIMAFFLQLNNVPAGSSELPASEAGQRAMKIEYPR